MVACDNGKGIGTSRYTGIFLSASRFPGLPLSPERRFVVIFHLRQTRPVGEQGVFVVDFHESHRGFLGIGIARKGVAMGQQPPGEILLYADIGAVEEVYALSEVETAVFVFGSRIGVGDVQIEICINTIALQFVDHPVELFELALIEFFHFGVPDTGRCRPHVHVVKAHHIIAELTQAPGQF